MSLIVADCPRCNSEKITFDIKGCSEIAPLVSHGNPTFEIFCTCKNCNTSTIFMVSANTRAQNRQTFSPTVIVQSKKALNQDFDIIRFVSIVDNKNYPAPEFLDEKIEAIFNEGTSCIAINCWNAAGAMFRQCLDIASKKLLPNDISEQERKKTKFLKNRLEWLIEKQHLKSGLEELIECIREDGNDGAHDGSLQKEDAMDLCEFTSLFLERTFTEPAKIKNAKERRDKRRQYV